MFDVCGDSQDQLFQNELYHYDSRINSTVIDVCKTSEPKYQRVQNISIIFICNI